MVVAPLGITLDCGECPRLSIVNIICSLRCWVEESLHSNSTHSITHLCYVTCVLPVAVIFLILDHVYLNTFL